MLRSGPPCEPASPEFHERLAAAGATLGRANVAAVYLVHGTFCGNDLLGMWTELARVAPGLSRQLRRVTKGFMNLMLGESGNYTARNAGRLQTGLSAGAGRPIPVRLFQWSSQNNHIARADAAVRLIDELASCAAELETETPAPSPTASAGRAGEEDQTNDDALPRILIWGHSHGGNVMALVTNLLGGDADARREFFDAARSFYRRGSGATADFPVWQRVEELLAGPSHPLQRVQLDLVTFGTPIRYGWETHGYSKLLHIHNHRPRHAASEWLAAHPPRWGRMLVGGDGDFIERLGVAGSGFPPLPLLVRTFNADRRLRRLLAAGAPRWVWGAMRHGSRVPHEGCSLLIDYAEPGLFPLQHMGGHVLYTRGRWLPLHCELVAEEFYGRPQEGEE